MRLVVIVLIALLALACGIAIEGRIDVGERTESPCPQGNP